MKIDVTAVDIKTGRRHWSDSHASSSCPISLAARRSYPGMTVSVSSNALRFHSGRDGRSRVIYSIELPYEAVRFIDEFDYQGRQAVEPFTFEIE